MKNYRPVSNFPFVSKIVEKVVASCLNTHGSKLYFRAVTDCLPKTSQYGECPWVENDILHAIEEMCDAATIRFLSLLTPLTTKSCYSVSEQGGPCSECAKLYVAQPWHGLGLTLLTGHSLWRFTTPHQSLDAIRCASRICTRATTVHIMFCAHS